MLPRGVTDQDVSRLLDRLLRIPRDARSFGVGAENAWRLHRVSPELLAHLRSRGLPIGHDGSYDQTDLLNIALYLGTSAASMAARRFWAAGMARADRGETSHYEIEYRVTCQQPGHDPVCRYLLRLPNGVVGRAESPPTASPVVAATVTVSLPAQWPVLPKPVRALLDVVRDIDFVRLPTAVRDDLAFIRSARISHCLGTARLLTEEGRRRGLPVRFASGFMVALPFSAVHHWAEVLVEDRWVPVDPVLITAMLDWGVLDPATWHRYRSPGSIFCRVNTDFVALVEHDGHTVDLAFPTRRLPAPDRTASQDGP